VLTLLLLNIFVSASDSIKLHKTLSKYEKRLNSHNSKTKKASKSSNKSTSEAKTLLAWSGKLKAFIIGFMGDSLSEILHQKNGDLANKIVVAVVDKCFDTTINEYEAVKANLIKEKPCDPILIQDLLGEASYESVASECALLTTARRLDDNEYSTLSRLGEGFMGLFKDNSKYKEEYAKFTKQKKIMEETAAEFTEAYKNKFEIIKDEKSSSADTRKVAQKLYSAMSGFLNKKDLCEALSECNSFGVLEHLKTLLLTGVGFLKCAMLAPLKALAEYGIKEVIDAILKKIGLSAVTSVAKMIFPAILVPLIIKFVVSKWRLLKKLGESLFKLASDEEVFENEEKELWGLLGETFSSILFMLLTRRKLKKMKFRKIE
jgi:hypothetical protein